MTNLASFQPAIAGSSQIMLGGQAAFNLNGPSCPNAQISCRNTTTVENLCCFNYPGGQLLQTQFWDTHPPTGPSDSWTLHGLWPDHCDGTFDQYCDDRRTYNNISAILRNAGADDTLDAMSLYWKDYQGDDTNLWKHEWSKHGTCISTLDPKCYTGFAPQSDVVDYFRTAVAVFKQLPSHQWLLEADITPGDKTYDLTDIQDALQARHGQPVTLRCRNGQLQEIWYHFDVQGSIQEGTFIATPPDGTKGNCPRRGIKYLPKSSSVNPRPTTTRHDGTPEPTQPGSSFSGRGHLMVNIDGHNKGCIISDGTWYLKGTCATFQANEKDGELELSSRKGKCSLASHDSYLKCYHSIRQTVGLGTHGDKLTANGNTTFWANKIPQGFKKARISSIKDGADDVEVQLVWQSA